MSSSTPEQPGGFDLDAHAWGGPTFRELIEFLSGVGANRSFFWGDAEHDLRAVLSPTSFVRLLCERGGTLFNVSQDPELLARNLPFLTQDEVRALCARFALERIEVPTPFIIVRHYRRMMIIDLFMKGETNREISRKIRCSVRYVRMVTSGLKRDVPRG